ncbi:MAG TPA: 50S ribosomal protein L35 [Spirochaetales bacterium]|nr:50S ribosomal protein L35 [Spirochaetaceae bacterium]HOZ72565.1 50S ribosomal protein L35 [Spirochaetales bacterium]HRW24640.1 50S ribosomal protein L35 [Spirochaetia bacterium]HPB67087.1 50S ribosomal protein L35 [Spirochaetales bacterium]HPE90205.1 50S ribosomal protein L35 [Spirochaetales bacterium]
MPKMKTKRAASKRYTLSADGKVKYKKMNLRHILTKKSSKRKRKLRKAGFVASGPVYQIKKKLLPYG